MAQDREREIREQLQTRRMLWEKNGVATYPARLLFPRVFIEEARKRRLFRKKTAIAGRVVTMRNMGKSAFATIEDQTGKIQLFFARDTLGDAYLFVKNLDRGDIIETQGELFKTKTGEVTLRVQDFHLLSKVVAPLPEKWHGLQDHEERQRRRYLDLLANAESRAIFEKRTHFIKHLRDELDRNRFLEVTTPVLQPLYGGAMAVPFSTHHASLDLKLYLRIAPELYLKRLLVGGWERVYEIASCFRNEGMSPQHLQEFYQLEMYMAYADYQQLMNFVEEFLPRIIRKTFGKLSFSYQGTNFDFTPPYPRLDFRELVLRDTGIDILQHKNVDELWKDIHDKKLTIDVPQGVGHGKLIDELYKTYSRKKISGPAFLIHHPTVLSPLAKQSEKDPRVVERFQLLLCGFEVMNGFSELNDPVEQKNRFLEQVEARKTGDAEAHEMDQDYIDALEFGMPPAAGLGMGIERMMALLTDQASVRDVVLFPLFRPKNHSSNHSSKEES